MIQKNLNCCNINWRNFRWGHVIFMIILKQKSTVNIKWARTKLNSIKKYIVHQILKKKTGKIFTKNKKLGLGSKNFLMKCNLIPILSKEVTGNSIAWIRNSQKMFWRSESVKMKLCGPMKMLLTNTSCMILWSSNKANKIKLSFLTFSLTLQIAIVTFHLIESIWRRFCLQKYQNLNDSCHKMYKDGVIQNTFAVFIT